MFGQQDKAHHRLYHKLRPPETTAHHRFDPLLSELCGAPSRRCDLYRVIDAFPEKLVYSAESDFPAFGARLLVLQNYVVMQSPNSIKALWHDRRDTHRFWTFWAVILVGGLSIFLSILQIILAGIQINLAIQQTRMGTGASLCQGPMIDGDIRLSDRLPRQARAIPRNE